MVELIPLQELLNSGSFSDLPRSDHDMDKIRVRVECRFEGVSEVAGDQFLH
jgi:hypothetical protein